MQFALMHPAACVVMGRTKSPMSLDAAGLPPKPRRSASVVVLNPKCNNVVLAERRGRPCGSHASGSSTTLVAR
jgi:hypothetical protein